MAEIERHREIGSARLAASRRRSLLTGRTAAAGTLMRFTTWTLMGAASIMAYVLYRGGGRFEWPSSSWCWWLWTSLTQTPPPGLDT